MWSVGFVRVVIHECFSVARLFFPLSVLPLIFHIFVRSFVCSLLLFTWHFMFTEFLEYPSNYSFYLLLILCVCVCFLLSVKVLKFNRRRPLPDAEDSEFQNTYFVNGMSNSVSVTGYRSVFEFIYLLFFVLFDFICRN